MNRHLLEIDIGRKYGHSIGWLANVINTRYTDPEKMLLGLDRLARENNVAPASCTLDYVLIDGAARPFRELEKYA